MRTKRELLAAVEPEPVDEARLPQLAADIRALVRLAIAEAEKAEAEGNVPSSPAREGMMRSSVRRAGSLQRRGG